MRDDAVARCGGLPRRGLMAAGVGAAGAFLVVRAGIAMERHLDRLLLDISETQHTNPEFFASTE